jgi:hypothetical protein
MGQMAPITDKVAFVCHCPDVPLEDCPMLERITKPNWE